MVFTYLWVYFPPHGCKIADRFAVMPIVSLSQTNPLIDGRQSENAMLVRRGVQRLFLEMGLAVMPELSLASGRRADLVALVPQW